MQIFSIDYLSSDLFANLWWIVACGGVLLATAFALLTRRLLDRHNTALELAKDNERLSDGLLSVRIQARSFRDTSQEAA